MKITRLELENFRCFQEAIFDLTIPDSDGKPTDLAVIIGSNGAGKTAALQGLAGFFGGFVGPLTGLGQYRPHQTPDIYQADLLTMADVRQGRDRAILRIAWRDSLRAGQAFQTTDQSFECEGFLFANNESLNSFVRERIDTNTLVGGSRPDLIFVSKPPHETLWIWREQVITFPSVSTGLIVYFDDTRLLPRIEVDGPHQKRVISHRCLGSLAPSDTRIEIVELETSDRRFAQLKQWIVNLNYERLLDKEMGERVSPVWDKLVYAINTILEPMELLGVVKKNLVRFRAPTGVVPLESLSSGFRSLFVIVADLVLRLSLSAPPGANPLHQEAVCLIDESDTRLDEELQRRLVNDLRTVFPNVQFIITTYSKLIEAAAKPYQVFNLEGASNAH